MTPRAVWAIGFGQLVNWGVLYYAFGVLLVPIEHDLAAPRWLVAGAFSLGLLVSAIAAPPVRHHIATAITPSQRVTMSAPPGSR